MHSNIFVCGFNKFGQLSPTINSKIEGCIKDIKFSWSYSLIFSDCEGTESVIYLAGSFLQKWSQLKRIILPQVEEDYICDGWCNDKFCLFSTKRGDLWKFHPTSNKWDKIVLQLFLEPSEDNPKDTLTCEPVLDRLATGENLNIVLLSNGTILNIPSVLQTSLSNFKVIDVSVGLEHALFLTQCGTVFTYGSGGRGQLGHGELNDEVLLREVKALSGLRITQVAAGGWHSIVLSYCGDLYSWGWNTSGQLGTTLDEEKGKPFKNHVVAEPTLITWPSDLNVTVEQVACGTRHCIALLCDGSVWGCGWNGYNQLPGLEGGKDNLYPQMMRLKMKDEKKVNKITCGAWNSAFFFS